MATFKKYDLKSKKSTDGKLLKPETRWMVKGYLGEDPKTGLPKYTTLRGFETKQSAKDAFESAMYDFKHGERQPDKRYRVAEVYDQWIGQYARDVEPSTLLVTKSTYHRHIEKQLGSYYIDSLGFLDLQKWMDKQEHAQRKTIGIISLMFKFAQQMGWAENNPTPLVKLPKVAANKRNIPGGNRYSVDEAKQFIAALNKLALKDPTGWGKRRVMLLLLLATGIRRGELIGLKWADVDFRMGTLKIRRSIKPSEHGEVAGKTKTITGVRTVALTPDTLRMLAQWCVTQAQRSDVPVSSELWLFTGKAKDGHMSLSTSLKWMTMLKKATGLRRVTLHGLRHTKATLLAQSGVNVTSIAAVLGHANVETTLRAYIHPTAEGEREAESVYAQLLADNKKPSGSNSGL